MKSNNWRKSYIGFMVHYFHFSFWNSGIAPEDFDSELTTTYDVEDAWNWRQNCDRKIISGLTFYKLIVF
jgi:hypothetical protein